MTTPVPSPRSPRIIGRCIFARMSCSSCRWLGIAVTVWALPLARAEVPPRAPGPDVDVTPSGQADGQDAPLCAVASGQDLGLFRLMDDTVLITDGGGPAAVCAHDKPCAALAGDPTRAARRLLPALAGTVTAAAGRWGKHVVLTRTIRRDEGENHEVLELAHGQWRAREDGERGWLPWYPRLVAARRGGGRIVGIAEFESDGAHASARQLLAAPPRPRVLALDVRPARRLLTAAANEELADLLLIGDGSTMVLLNRTVGGTGLAVVDRLGSGAGKPRVDRLPSPCLEARAGGGDSDVEALGMDGRRADDVYVALSASCDRRRLRVLAHFDGQGWRITPGPPTDHDSDDMSVGPDGTLWLAAGGALYRRAPSGDWTTTPIAVGGQDCAARQVVARESGDILVSATCGPSPASASRAAAAPSSSLVFGERCPGPPLPLSSEQRRR